MELDHRVVTYWNHTLLRLAGPLRALLAITLLAAPAAGADLDTDGIPDPADNCLEVANASQQDTDADGFGNACDADYTGDGRVGIADFNLFRQAFGRIAGEPGFDPALDANDDGAIGISDFNAFRRAFGGVPGPSGLACAGLVPCPTTIACSDGLDNDGDGLFDHPADPGCRSADDTFEFDAKPGDLFVADYAGSNPRGAIWHVDGETGEARVLLGGAPVNRPHSLAIHRGGLIFSEWDAQGTGSIDGPGGYFRLDLETGEVTAIASDLPTDNPGGIAVTRSGEILNPDFATHNLVMTHIAKGEQSVVTTAGRPRSAVVTSANRVFVTDSLVDGVVEVDLATGTRTTIASSSTSLGQAWWIVEDEFGDLIVANIADDRLYRVDPNGGGFAEIQTTQPLGGLAGVAVTPRGDIVVVDAAAKTLRRLEPGWPHPVSELTTSRPFVEPYDVVAMPEGEMGWVPGPDSAVWARYDVRGDEVIVDGDISYELAWLRAWQDELLSGGQFHAAADQSYRWPNGVVRYDAASLQSLQGICAEWTEANADGEYQATETCLAWLDQEVQDAMDLWRNQTLIRFVEETQGQRLVFKHVTEGSCRSGVGRRGNETTVSLRTPCGAGFGSIVHELGHAIGFYHEQSRSDRYQHARFNDMNTADTGQFSEAGVAWGEYSYGSIMHYGTYGLGEEVCCTVDGVDVERNGLPNGCGWLANVGMDTDGDGEADTCPAAQTFRDRMRTLIPHVGIPGSRVAGDDECRPSFLSEPWHEPCVMGQRRDLSKGDRAGANALALAEKGQLPNDYNSLSQRWHASFTTDAGVHVVGDFDGNGRDDVASFRQGPLQSGRAGDVDVVLSRPVPWPGYNPLDLDGFFEDQGTWYDVFCLDWETCAAGDVDGDGDDDIVAFNPKDGNVWVSLSTKTGFAQSSKWHHRLPFQGEVFKLADVDGDGDDDAVAIHRYTSAGVRRVQVYVALSNRTSFGNLDTNAPLWLSAPGNYALLGDVTSGGGAELVTVASNDDVTVYATSGNAFVSPGRSFGNHHCGFNWCQLADMDGDGRDDLVAMDAFANHYVTEIGETVAHHLDRVRISLSTGCTFSVVTDYHELDCRNEGGCLLGDVDDDGFADVIDPIRTTSSSQDRTNGELLVSRSTGVRTNDVGPRLSPWLGLGFCDQGVIGGH
ncbi:MAG: VCBS repeat-containing protein [Deltaproteobacteria bacterium]|nr:VCBS repeat-containing protein [Deltaproteobacteria bacterium]MBW2420130.1 VCBS repeat-containing protein [Deltaproteobacteria bacterium]